MGRVRRDLRHDVLSDQSHEDRPSGWSVSQLRALRLTAKEGLLGTNGGTPVVESFAAELAPTPPRVGHPCGAGPDHQHPSSTKLRIPRAGALPSSLTYKGSGLRPDRWGNGSILRPRESRPILVARKITYTYARIKITKPVCLVRWLLRRSLTCRSPRRHRTVRHPVVIPLGARLPPRRTRHHMPWQLVGGMCASRPGPCVLT